MHLAYSSSTKYVSAYFQSRFLVVLITYQIDMLLPKRGTSSSSENTSDRIITSFLTEMDGLLTQRSMETAHIDVLVVGGRCMYFWIQCIYG